MSTELSRRLISVLPSPCRAAPLALVGSPVAPLSCCSRMASRCCVVSRKEGLDVGAIWGGEERVGGPS